MPVITIESTPEEALPGLIAYFEDLNRELKTNPTTLNLNVDDVLADPEGLVQFWRSIQRQRMLHWVDKVNPGGFERETNRILEILHT